MTAVIGLAIQGCKQDEAASASVAGSNAAVMTVGPENIAVIKAEEIRTGPTLSGTLSAETEATVRAEVSVGGLRNFARRSLEGSHRIS